MKVGIRDASACQRETEGKRMRTCVPVGEELHRVTKEAAAARISPVLYQTCMHLTDAAIRDRCLVDSLNMHEEMLCMSDDLIWAFLRFQSKISPRVIQEAC